MRCPEFQAVIRQFIDGSVDKPTRKAVAWHLAECADCARLINDDKFWDDAVLSLLECEAPADLRVEILGDLAGRDSAIRPSLSSLGWRKQLKIVGWATTRKQGVRQWLEVAAIVTGAILFVQFTSGHLTTRGTPSFRTAGPVSLVIEGQVLAPDVPLASASLSFADRLF